MGIVAGRGRSQHAIELFNFTLRISKVVCDLEVFVYESPAPLLQATVLMLPLHFPWWVRFSERPYHGVA